MMRILPWIAALAISCTPPEETPAAASSEPVPEPARSSEEDAWARAVGQISEDIVRPLLGHETAVTAVAMAHAGRLIASGAEDGRIILWDAGVGVSLRDLRGHTGEVTSLA